MLSEKRTLSLERLAMGEMLVRRNWRLVRLDTNNLDNRNINKINTICDRKKGVNNKIEMVRFLMKRGINTLNIDRLFLALQTLQR